MKISDITESNVIQGPWGKSKVADNPKVSQLSTPVSGRKNRMQKTTLRQAFGSDILNLVYELGGEFVEKPSYFSEIVNSEKYTPMTVLHKLKNQYGFRIPVMRLSDTLKLHKGEFYPQASLRKEPTVETFLLKVDVPVDGAKLNDLFLCDRSGASSYIRMWSHIR